MTTPERKRELKEQVRAAERRSLVESLPLGIELLKELLSFLDRESAPPCDHSLRETIGFLRTRGVDPATVVPWLQKHGGYCDCEVIYNVYDAVGEIVGWHLDS